MKVCAVCNENKDYSDYYSQQKKRKDGTPYIYYNPECKTCSIKRSAKWQKNNKEIKNASNAKYMSSKVGREVRKKYQKKFREEGRQIDWQRTNKEKTELYRSQRLHMTHKISKSEWQSCKEYFDNKCAYCKLEITKHYITYNGITKLGDFHKDHFRHDGGNDISNCIPSCKECNTSKKDKEFEAWYIEHEKYSEENVNKIFKWLNEDHKLYIQEKKPRKQYTRKIV